MTDTVLQCISLPTGSPSSPPTGSCNEAGQIKEAGTAPGLASGDATVLFVLGPFLPVGHGKQVGSIWPMLMRQKLMLMPPGLSAQFRVEKTGAGAVGLGILLAVGRAGTWSLIGGSFCAADGARFMHSPASWWHFRFSLKMSWANSLTKNANCGSADGAGNMAVTPENGWLGGRRRMSRATGTDTILQDLWQRPNVTCFSSAACPITNNPAGRVRGWRHGQMRERVEPCEE